MRKLVQTTINGPLCCVLFWVSSFRGITVCGCAWRDTIACYSIVSCHVVGGYELLVAHITKGLSRLSRLRWNSENALHTFGYVSVS